VAALVPGEAVAVLELASGLEVSHRVDRVVVVAGGVVVAALHEHLQVRVVAHGGSEHVADDGLLVLRPRPHVAPDEVLDLRVVLQLRAEVLVDGRAERAVPIRDLRRVFGALARCVQIHAQVAGVETSDRHPRVAEQFLPVPLVAHAQVRLQDELLAQAGESGHLRRNGVALGIAELVALHQRRQVLAHREGFGVGERRAQGLRLQVRHEPLVVPRGGGLG